jgi:uridine phosphorylase
MPIQPADLILNSDGSIFHLKLHPGEVADNVILVGDPGRVDLIGQFLKHIEYKKHNREFRSLTGFYKNKRITVISSGIGSDNIDIVLNELDALKNIDFQTRKINNSIQPINIIRIGTSGSMQENISPGSFILTEKAIGFDNLAHFYNIQRSSYNQKIELSLKSRLKWNERPIYPYITDASEVLKNKFRDQEIINGMTISAPGFYGPQGRKLRIALADENINNKIQNFQFNNLRITNYEMESSAIYTLSKALGHNALTICAVIANRITNEYIVDYRSNMENLTVKVLDNF